MIRKLAFAATLLLSTPLFAQVPVEATMAVPRVPGQNPNGMHIYIRAGLKTHLAGQHDYPQFLADWSKLLTAKGAVVDGSLHAPSAEELATTDVLILDRGDTGFTTPVERAALQAYVKRGGGIVVLHDAECGPDPADMASLVGAGKKHGEKNYTLEASVPYTIVDRANPIMAGMTDLTLTDEAFFKMTWATNPAPHILATAIVADTPSAAGHAGEVAPQIWTYEHTLPGGKPARAFVWMQGHIYANYANPQIQAMLLRGIAWAAGKPVDTLVDYKPAPRPAG
ncbi:ThuA domain-containing protein [Polymorphobacter sp. PAMC 29334]|uniref:ThuA domain-containing protein n=1 Tax=Polymorphobacter sp. PAMC 29334 TaxID=2862331 RepID=UPI001C673648|nr:ThuA domain-containing protein [Polymorphobacter sp. PAMC 29334]QYE34895.1 ThuA domain-containing protein [Polymorphobacter sp. PAMC 29334]